MCLNYYARLHSFIIMHDYIPSLLCTITFLNYYARLHSFIIMHDFIPSLLCTITFLHYYARLHSLIIMHDTILLFFPSQLKPHCHGMVMGFVDAGGNIAIETALPPSFVYCIVNIK